ncbi:hypothetical protein PAPHI01_0749 [Pancytospora philotis]|nr:hypothetical protein PAPHI01_0749 [Pancytospora philotis]
MYLGAYLTTYSGAGAELYSTAQRKQRYRHRYALRNTYANAIEDRGLRFVGKANYERTVAFKLDHHRFFAGVQYHPELGSTRASVDPIIVEFVSSATAQARNNSNKYVL